MPPAITHRRALALGGVVLTGIVALALTACAPEPVPGASASPAPSITLTTPPSTIPSPVPTDEPQSDDITLPADCPAIYSSAMLDRLNAENPPLNDPGVTLYSTELTTGLEILDTAPTIRCSWGLPSESGLATNVTTVDAGQVSALEAAMLENGMECDDDAGGTLCRAQGENIDGNDVKTAFGETHFLRGNTWIATHWINYAPEGYTQDIAAVLWG